MHQVTLSAEGELKFTNTNIKFMNFNPPRWPGRRREKVDIKFMNFVSKFMGSLLNVDADAFIHGGCDWGPLGH